MERISSSLIRDVFLNSLDSSDSPLPCVGAWRPHDHLLPRRGHGHAQAAVEAAPGTGRAVRTLLVIVKLGRPSLLQSLHCLSVDVTNNLAR